MNTYEVITAIVASYGALLATYTLIVQLRQSSRRIKVSFTPGFIDTGGHLGESMFILEGANIGHVDVTLTGHAISSPSGSQIIFRNPGTEHRFPHTLKPGNRCIVWFPAQEIAETLKNKGFNKTVKIFGVLHDATGIKHKSKSVKFDINSWLHQ